MVIVFDLCSITISRLGLVTTFHTWTVSVLVPIITCPLPSLVLKYDGPQKQL